MSITIRINNTNEKAGSIINLLKTLALDYDFIEILDDAETLPELTISEYNKRYKYTLENLGEGLTIKEMENKLYPDDKE